MAVLWSAWCPVGYPVLAEVDALVDFEMGVVCGPDCAGLEVGKRLCVVEEWCVVQVMVQRWWESEVFGRCELVLPTWGSACGGQVRQQWIGEWSQKWRNGCVHCWWWPLEKSGVVRNMLSQG